MKKLFVKGNVVSDKKTGMIYVEPENAKSQVEDYIKNNM